MNTSKRGELSEGIILSALLRLDIPVSIPFGNSQRYDFIIDENARLLKIQCKTGKLKNGCISFNVTSRSYYKTSSYHGQVDEFFVYCPDNEKIYRFPVKESNHSVCTLRVDPPKNKQQSCVKYAKDYEFFVMRQAS